MTSIKIKNTAPDAKKKERKTERKKQNIVSWPSF